MGLFSSTNPCKKAGTACSSDTDCCSGIEVCDHGSCVSHTSDPVHYEDGTSCVKTCNTPLPKGAKPYCYANDDEHPNEIQFCAYEKDGFLFEVDGCCDKICPSEQCPVSVAAPAPPQKDRPKGIPYKPRAKKNISEPLPMLLKMLLLIFAVLLVSAAIFLSVG